MSTLILPAVQLGLQTRARQQVANSLDRAASTAGADIHIAALKRQYTNAEHRSVGPSYLYNCHGLTFASRRTTIWDASEVQKILNDDEYVPIAFAEVSTGDIAVYMQDNAAVHSGLVVGKAQFQARILSKWGRLHEVVHWQNDCEYMPAVIKFYRINV